MEGLIKGLIDVALGGGVAGDDDGRRRRQESGDGGEQDERSRSSWAEVVGGHDAEEDRRNSRQQPHQYQQPQQGYEQGSGAWGRPGFPSSGWEAGDGREDCGSGRGRNDGDWETVGDRHREKNKSRPQAKVETSHWGGYKRPASEQEYASHLDDGVDVEPTQEELHDLPKACSRLWELDLNRLIPGKDYEIDCGEGKKVYQKEDLSSGSLFSWLGDDVFSRPTYARFCSLLDNYNPSQGSREVVTAEEKQEQAAFIEEISRTAPIKYLFKCLVSKGITSRDYDEFKRMLTGLWFDLCARGGVSGSSSAFEHVFVGETKEQGEGEVSGFHNWIQFYLEEAKGRVDYHGYIFPRRRCQNPDSQTQLLSIQFAWNGVLKAVSSTLIGVSPEFEVALYTLCFFLGGEDNLVSLGPYSVNIKCYRYGDRIGSVFPVSCEG